MADAAITVDGARKNYGGKPALDGLDLTVARGTVHGSPAEFLAAMGLLLLFRFAMLWIGIQLALVAGKPELVQAVQILVWPVGFLSNAFATPDSMPDWLGLLAVFFPPAVRRFARPGR
ncbi:hypothetical protein ACQEWB_26915 [Streptomyces sp. CA-249302]|uniref:hypothetical protein n=1 Tax=Streptomyces sp. CA-249302 TaxID=3240058 RepID=UPI003D8C1556